MNLKKKKAKHSEKKEITKMFSQDLHILVSVNYTPAFENWKNNLKVQGSVLSHGLTLPLYPKVTLHVSVTCKLSCPDKKFKRYFQKWPTI